MAWRLDHDSNLNALLWDNLEDDGSIGGFGVPLFLSGSDTDSLDICLPGQEETLSDNASWSENAERLLEVDEDMEGDEGDIRDVSLHCLEDFVLSFLTQLVEVFPVAYNEVDAPKPGPKRIKIGLADRRKSYDGNDLPMREISMPQRSKGPSARPFAQVLRTVDLMHEALTSNVPTTKRDIYYKDVGLFGSQSTVDRLVDDLAATFKLSRADLGVRASSKGLICGAGLTMHLHCGDAVHMSDIEPALIPHSEDIERFDVNGELAWVLVVEKEAVFQTLCRLRLATHAALPGKGLVITGKGYPDVATRQLVQTLSTNLPPHVPVLALVDGDAYGIDILSVYKNGSTSMQHENVNLAAARVRWLGLWSSELAALGIQKDALLPITKHDEKKARSMLKRDGLPVRWRKELQHMLFTRRKAEIEVLSAVGSADYAAELRGSGCMRSGGPGSSGTPLLRYLLAKISSACLRADRTDPRLGL
ncbi:Spo11/DNA topoisomerase VI subunit A [Trametes maxima]|nr:Spo11/DNA topoisomerase VI subunit A [Trametes maxima]